MWWNMEQDTGSVKALIAPPVTPEQLYQQDERRRTWDAEHHGVVYFMGWREVELGWYEARNPPGPLGFVKRIPAEPDPLTINVDEVEEYLDGAIRMWRKKRDAAEEGGEVWAEACCYVDAFQSVRISLVGLPLIDA